MTQARDIASDLGLRIGAGDGNRTRAISLGIQPIGASDRSDLDSRHTASDRHGPRDTRANGPPMARRSCLLAEPRGPSRSRRSRRVLQEEASRATRGICSQTAVAATQRSASCSFWPRPCPVRTHQARSDAYACVRFGPGHTISPGYLMLQALEPVRDRPGASRAAGAPNVAPTGMKRALPGVGRGRGPGRARRARSEGLAPPRPSDPQAHKRFSTGSGRRQSLSVEPADRE
jgi:hypothetical protein